MVTKTNYNQILIDKVKAETSKTKLWEINNPRVNAMCINLLEMVERDKSFTREQYLYLEMIVLASIRVFGRKDVSSELLSELNGLEELSYKNIVTYSKPKKSK